MRNQRKSIEINSLTYKSVYSAANDANKKVDENENDSSPLQTLKKSFNG